MSLRRLDFKSLTYNRTQVAMFIVDTLKKTSEYVSIVVNPQRSTAHSRARPFRLVEHNAILGQLCLYPIVIFRLWSEDFLLFQNL